MDRQVPVSVDEDIVWQVVTEDLPKLVTVVHDLVAHADDVRPSDLRMMLAEVN